MKVLVIGPSPVRSQGGMATVIKNIKEDPVLNNKFDIDIYESFIDGPIITRYLFSIISFIRFFFIYRKYDIFYVHMASYGSTFRKGYYIRFLKKREKKIVLHIHGAEYLLFYSKLSGKKKEIVHDIWEKADLVIVLSEAWKERFKKIFTNAKLLVIHNGIDIEKYYNAQCDILNYRKNFLFLGRLGKRKGVYDLINAVQLVTEKDKRIKIYLAGDGEIELVKATIRNAGLNKQIEVEGWVDFIGKINLMKKVSTVILPSYNEGLPMAILEGMAAGKVIISTKVGAIPEVITDYENGILIDAGDVEALSDAIIKVINDSEFIQRCSENNKKKIENSYSEKIMHKQIENALIEVFNERF